MSSRRLISWLFALALLLGQATAFAHAIGHLHGHDTGLHDKVCEVCVAQAQLGSGLPVSPVVLALLSPHASQQTNIASVCVDLSPLAACARAPPTPFDR